MKYSHISFDFDGVICDSVGLKKSIFRDVLLDNNFEESKVDYYLDQSKGLDRYSRFNYVVSSIEKKKKRKCCIDDMVEDFKTRYALASKSTFEPNEKLNHLIMHLKDKGKIVSCVSASPHSELSNHINLMGLKDHFDFISGGPPCKLSRTEKLLRQIGISRGETVYIGDSKSDFLMAKKLGISFIACSMYISSECEWIVGLETVGEWKELYKLA